MQGKKQREEVAGSSCFTEGLQKKNLTVVAKPFFCGNR